MPQHPALDETARLEGPAASLRPPLGDSGSSDISPAQGTERPAEATDDTRPVPRDWMLGAPDAAAPDAPAKSPLPGDDWHTQQLSPVDAPPAGDPEDRGDDSPTDDVDATGVLPVEDRDTPGAENDSHEDSDDAGTPPGPPAGPGASGPRRPWWRRRAVLVPAAAVAVLGAAYGADLLVAGGDIPRHTVVGGVDIGGMSPAAASRTLQRELAPRIAADRTVVADDVQATISPANAGLTLDVDRTLEAAADQPLNPWTRIVTLFDDRTVAPVISTDDGPFGAQLDALAQQVDVAPVDATIALDGTTPSLVQPADGRRLDRRGAARAITSALADGTSAKTPIDLPVDVAHVHVDAAAAQQVLDETVTPALSAPVSLLSPDGGTTAEIPVPAIAAALTFTPKDDGTLAVTLDPARLQAALGEELGVFGTPATDATFKVSGDAISVVPSVDGTGVDPAALAEQLLPVLTAPAPRSVTAQLGPVPAAFTTEQAQALGITEQVSSFTTHFTSPASGTNIRVVAEKVNGAVVKPGETFSLNTFTGPRGTAQGYVPAAVISGGNLSQAVGGGISQFATTMFNAVFFAGLEDIHHKPHSFYISRYPAGREATVYEGQIDLVWKNDTDTGIYVQTTWVPGTITVTFWGTKHYEIESVSGPRTNVRDPAVQDKVDDGHCTPQSGTQGFDITVTRVFHDPNSGAELKREDFHTHYIAESVIHCVPPAPGAPAAPGGTAPAPAPGPSGRRPTRRTR